ncbi:hypothetical protein [Pseudalkalibacillus hwajinpoensis]|uniref:DUF4878 domain-containing protein n=1 Tax=Guptibacillus hwajinpoensis TaxID=208199 RepID=A0A4U1MHS9_9BACL|nr:hypothetical protein [Pseudalkalibacillus hwajinpoensis]TKD70869.1 hypothetical protein FBF83_09660 [Pseudalkalibacillus hwajinpoensis]
MSHFKTRRQHGGGGGKVIVILCVLLLLAGAITFFILQHPKSKASATVKEFYLYEQSGDFKKSWQLFHTEMKNRFSDEQYSQLRSQLITQDIGSTSFTYTVGKVKTKKNWRSSVNGVIMKKVYVMKVTQNFHNQFGNFSLVQEVFVAKEDGEYKVVWDYQ